MSFPSPRWAARSKRVLKLSFAFAGRWEGAGAVAWGGGGEELTAPVPEPRKRGAAGALGVSRAGHLRKVREQVEATEPEADRATEIQPMGSAPPKENESEVREES